MFLCKCVENVYIKKKTSQYRGIYLPTKSNRWVARIDKVHIGCFSSEMEAAKAYDTRTKKIYGDKAILNFYD